MFFATNTLASERNQMQIDMIIKQDTPPFGVVFEVVEHDGDALAWALPDIKKYAKQLKDRFPDIGIAVVSHGREEFALLTSEKNKRKEIHKTVQSLVNDDTIPVHICGTHASWYGKKPGDFPDYVDVAPSGPAQITNYEDMGYELVVLHEK